MLIVNTLLVLNLGHSPLYRHFCKCLVSTQPLPPPYIKGAGEPLIIFVLTFVYLNLPCDCTGEKLFVVLLTLYKSAEYISEILLHIETYIFACLNERIGISSFTSIQSIVQIITLLDSLVVCTLKPIH